jgi:predicted transcriptional regulator
LPSKSGTHKEKIKTVSPGNIQDVAKALSSDLRLKIVEILGWKAMTISQLVKELGVAQPTVSINVQVLEQSGLIITAPGPNREKICSRVYDSIVLELPNRPGDALQDIEEIMMPVGMYTDCKVESPCGLAGKDGVIGAPDDPRSFYLPERCDASLLWFSGSGYVEYRFPNPFDAETVQEVEAVCISAEICSEAAGYRHDWPSDITLFVNGRNIGTWTSPGDFGEPKGRLTPAWWMNNTQYGLMTEWRVGADASLVNGVVVSGTRLEDLQLESSQPITVRFEVSPDAEHQGGINLLGAHFGNYPQDIKLTFVKKNKRRQQDAAE